MTLFDECREALNACFDIVDDGDKKNVIDLLHRFPFWAGGTVWREGGFLDFESIEGLLEKNVIKNESVFVLADDEDIPIFKSNLRLIARNIYDVTALSPKIFIFNEEFLIQPLFPTEIFRLGIKDKGL